MAVVPIRKTRSAPGRHMMPSAGAGMVLLTKQDIDNLQACADGSKELPRPMGVPRASCAVTPALVAMPANLGGSSGRAQPQRGFMPQRRVRSANGSRPPLPNSADMNILRTEDNTPTRHTKPQVVETVKKIDFSLVFDASGAAKRQAESQRRAPGAVQRVERLPRQRSMEAVQSHGHPLGGPRVQTPPRSSNRTTCGTAKPSLSAPPAKGARIAVSGSCPPLPGVRASSLLGDQFGVSGMDPRRLPRPADQVLRPADQVLRAVELGLLGPSTVGSGMAAGLGGLQVSGLAPPVCSQQVDEAEVIDWEAVIWSSSEDGEELEDDAQANNGVSFDYREFRYQRHQEAHARAAPPDPRRRGAKGRRLAAAQVRDDSCDSWTSPWQREQSSPLRCDAGLWCSTSSSAIPSQGRGSTPCCEEEPLDDELRHVGEVLVKFYDLPAGVDRGLRLKNNVVTVLEHAWVGKRRESQLTEPPMLWVRGGRVYDFHGDRGTVAEFTNDFLVRGVEDDAICRQRRWEQGLMPFPFLAAPVRGDEDADGQADATALGVRKGPRAPVPLGCHKAFR